MKAKLEKLMVLVVALTIGPGASVTNADLVAHWKLDEATGKIATDSSGNGHRGMLKGNPAWVAGRIDGALDFDGSDDCIDIDARIVEGSFSFALWLRHNKEEGLVPVLYNDTKSIGAVRVHLAYANPRLRVGIHQGAGKTLPKKIESNTVLAKNRWYFLVATYDTSTNIASIYVDGLLDKEKGLGVNIPYVGPLQIGVGSKNKFDGVLDDIRIFDHALGADDVAALYSQYFPGQSRTLLALLRATRDARAMSEQKSSRDVTAFLEKRISEYESMRQKKPDGVGLPGESLYFDMYFMLAQARKSAGAPDRDVIAAYERSVPRETYRPSYVPDLLWLFENIPADSYVDVVTRNVRDNPLILNHVRRVVNGFKTSGNWAAFEPFLDAGFAAADANDAESYAMITADVLKNNQEWIGKFSEYCRSKPELKQYFFKMLEERAQKHVEQKRFRKAAEVYQDILNQCDPNENRASYEFNLCKCLFNSGQYPEALSELAKFLKKNAVTNRALAREAIVLKGRAHMQIGELDHASDAFLELMIDYPEAKKGAEANFFVGYCSMLKGELAEAEETLRLVTKDFPESSFAGKARLCLARIKRMKE